MTQVEQMSSLLKLASCRADTVTMDAVTTTQEEPMSDVKYDTMAQYYRIVAAEAAGLIINGEQTDARDAIDVAFGTVEPHHSLNTNLDPTPDEIAVVRALVHCMTSRYPVCQ